MIELDASATCVLMTYRQEVYKCAWYCISNQPWAAIWDYFRLIYRLLTEQFPSLKNCYRAVANLCWFSGLLSVVFNSSCGLLCPYIYFGVFRLITDYSFSWVSVNLNIWGIGYSMNILYNLTITIEWFRNLYQTLRQWNLSFLFEYFVHCKLIPVCIMFYLFMHFQSENN